MPVPLIKQANRLLRKRQFSRAINLLEPKIFHYRNSFQYYYILGISCLANGDLSGATSYLNRAAQLNATDIHCRLALAALQFMKANVDETLKAWLDIIETDKKNKTANAGLAMMRRGIQPADVFEDPKKRALLLPLPRKKLPILPIGIAFAVLAIAAAASIYLPKLWKPRVQTRVEAKA
jgi:tetratricopeptide (TPR) repeat protein